MPKKFLLACGIIFVIAGCATSSMNSSDSVKGAPLEMGIEARNFDTSQRPQDDFFRYVNGSWLKNTEIPSDKSNYGSFTELYDQSELIQREIIDAAAAGKLNSKDAQRIGNYFAAYMNEDAVNAAGVTPLEPWLKQIKMVNDKDALMKYFGGALKLGFASPVAFWVNQDARNTTEYIPYLSQTGLSLPDRDYYLEDSDKFNTVRQQFLEHIEKMYALTGLPNGAAAASNILALETKLAAMQWERVRNRDRNATYNPVDREALRALMPGVNIDAFLVGAQVDDQTNFIVRQPDYLTSLATLIQDTPMNVWTDYLNWNLLDTTASLLIPEIVEADFDFYGRALSGVQENRPRWKRAVSAVNGALGEAVGRIYVEQTFAPESKQRMDIMVENLRTVFGTSIKNLDWMGDATKEQALQKLKKFTPKIGYPDEWTDYSGLEVSATDPVANALASAQFQYGEMLAKLGGPIDRQEWFMTPQTVNAYYNPSMNEIVFPAAILQPPFFNVAADDAVNYGGIGAVIGHEFSHGFDDQGRKSDGDGTLRDWWTEQDATEFKRRADGLVDQFAAYSPLAGENVDGKLTLGENIGDLAGLTMAYRAYQLSLNGKEAPVIGGFSGDQRFFMGWAQVWRRLYKQEELSRRLLTDPHSPSEYRVNGIVANMPEFHRAFDVNPGDKLYRSPADIIKIW